MFQFSGGFPKIDIHIDKFKKTLDQKLKTEIRNGAREWLRATYQRVPVYTGTARGTLVPVGKLLRVAVPISPIAKRKGKGPSFGATQSAFDFTFTETTYSFTFDQNLFYYKLNDLYPNKIIKSAPWYSFDAGAQAFQRYYRQSIKNKLPQLKDYVFVSEVRIG
jgi:hypothetical protein